MVGRLKNYSRQKIKEDGVLYTGVFWFLVALTLVSVLGLLTAMFSSGSDGILYKLIGAHTKLQLIQTLGSGILGCLAVLGVMAATRRAKAANITAANQVEATKEAKEANIEKAFATAIAQLASESNSVRLGCIYSLHDIAKKDKGRHRSISTILCMHLREKTKKKQYQEKYKDEPSDEIQYLLDILTQLDKEGNFIWDGTVKDFSGAYLTGANLNSASLKEANLTNAQLQGARLYQAQLQGADLRGAQLQRSHLGEAQLQGAELQEAQLQEVYLYRAQLQGADLEEAQLQGADLRGAQLQRAKLNYAQLQGAYLVEVQLQGADLRGAQLQGAHLEDAQLQRANLNNAQLQGAHLEDAQLQGAHLEDAQLQGATASAGRIAFLITSVIGFEEWINRCKNKNSVLKEVFFSGGIDAKKAQEITNSSQSLYKESGIDKWEYEKMKEVIEQHKGKEGNYEVIPDPPEYENLKKKYGFETGVLTEEEVDRIIAEYKQAMKKAGVEE